MLVVVGSTWSPQLPVAPSERQNSGHFLEWARSLGGEEGQNPAMTDYLRCHDAESLWLSRGQVGVKRVGWGERR